MRICQVHKLSSASFEDFSGYTPTTPVSVHDVIVDPNPNEEMPQRNFLPSIDGHHQTVYGTLYVTRRFVKPSGLVLNRRYDCTMTALQVSVQDARHVAFGEVVRR